MEWGPRADRPRDDEEAAPAGQVNPGLDVVEDQDEKRTEKEVY